MWSQEFTNFLASYLPKWPDLATDAVASHLTSDGLIVRFYDGDKFVEQRAVYHPGALNFVHGSRAIKGEYFKALGPIKPPESSGNWYGPGPIVEGARASYPLQAEGYDELAAVLHSAFEQSATGKGKERHVKEAGQAFTDQPICSLQRIYGPGYAYGQVGKKMEEAQRLPRDRAVAELRGAIVYLAAAIIVLEEGGD